MLVILYNYLILLMDATIISAVTLPAVLTVEVYFYVSMLVKFITFMLVLNYAAKQLRNRFVE